MQESAKSAALLFSFCAPLLKKIFDTAKRIWFSICSGQYLPYDAKSILAIFVQFAPIPWSIPPKALAASISTHKAKVGPSSVGKCQEPDPVAQLEFHCPKQVAK